MILFYEYFFWYQQKLFIICLLFHNIFFIYVFGRLKIIKNSVKVEEPPKTSYAKFYFIDF